MSPRSKGVACGIAAAVSYGMIPLFTLPLYSAGIGANSVLFYRYAIAVIISFILHKIIRKNSLKINLREGLCLFGMGLLFSMSSLTLFMSFKHIDAGLACTMLFVYPVMTALIMAVFFKERLNKSAISAIAMATIGIFLLYNGGDNARMNVKGAALVIASALSYVMLFGLAVFAANLSCTGLQKISRPVLWLYPMALALLPTILSLETLTVSIKLIGPSSTAVLGALEPLTAIFIGILVFGEHITARIAIGIILVLSGVMLIAVKRGN